MSDENKIVKQDKKPADNKKDKKPGLGARISRWLREMRSELKKVVWPNRKQLTNNSIIVIIAVLVVGAAIALLDALFLQGLSGNYGLVNLIRGLL